ncbi:MAG TPA: hypothetical protein PK459_01370 [Anaerolineaceae bacterium]|nr:hypothetical protein [Anaerolineaceae bacterium]
MRERKNRIWHILIGFVFALTALVACRSQDAVKQKLVSELTSLATIQDFDDITVSTYSINPWLFPRERYTVAEIEKFAATKKFTLNGAEIEGKLDLFGEIKESDFELSHKANPKKTRFYVLIESAEDGKLLEMLLFGGYSTYIVNGVEIKPSDKILEALTPLLSESALRDLEVYRDRECYCD